ncbi:hypothetical protein AAFF_G00041230 [Aldrovandia affinis]|uniref:Uncharacterized protein n=1 Tax=Aldrovandia affinis TaxID=143900 RepID=A0AAD7WFD4_9TELE|nr:hypothetical protein AAFF_G00041230 [Aldrovandia affinis]
MPRGPLRCAAPLDRLPPRVRARCPLNPSLPLASETIAALPRAEQMDVPMEVIVGLVTADCSSQPHNHSTVSDDLSKVCLRGGGNGAQSALGRPGPCSTAHVGGGSGNVNVSHLLLLWTTAVGPQSAAEGTGAGISGPVLSVLSLQVDYRIVAESSVCPRGGWGVGACSRAGDLSDLFKALFFKGHRAVYEDGLSVVRFGLLPGHATPR